MKPGYRTTEFWLSAVSALIGLLTMSGVIETGSPLGNIIGGIGTFLVTMGYTWARGLSKSGGGGTPK